MNNQEPRWKNLLWTKIAKGYLIHHVCSKWSPLEVKRMIATKGKSMTMQIPKPLVQLIIRHIEQALRNCARCASQLWADPNLDRDTSCEVGQSRSSGCHGRRGRCCTSRTACSQLLYLLKWLFVWLSMSRYLSRSHWCFQSGIWMLEMFVFRNIEGLKYLKRANLFFGLR